LLHIYIHAHLSTQNNKKYKDIIHVYVIIFDLQYLLDFTAQAQSSIFSKLSIAKERSGSSIFSFVEEVSGSNGSKKRKFLSAIFMLWHLSDTKSDNGTGSLYTSIPNALPWHQHVGTNHHILRTPEDARSYKAYSKNPKTNTWDAYTLDPDAFFVTDAKLDVTIVALSYESSVAVMNEDRHFFTLDCAALIAGTKIGNIHLNCCSH
jgi:hypothetical protein